MVRRSCATRGGPGSTIPSAEWRSASVQKQPEASGGSSMASAPRAAVLSSSTIPSAMREGSVGAARARLKQAEAELEKAARDYARSRELFSRHLIAAQQLDQAKAASEVADGAGEAARKQLIQAQEH